MSLSLIPSLAFFTPGPVEIVIIVGVMVMLFGKRLPEVGRSLGKGIVEFKKGVKGIDQELKGVDQQVDAQKRAQDASAAAAQWTCSGCGTANEAISKFCGSCGAKADA